MDWINSNEFLEESKKGRTYLGRPRDREENRSNREGIECDSCSPILNHLSKLSINLPLIDILIPSPIQANQKGKRAKLRAIRAVKEISRAKAFLDSGALGGNFVSPGFAEDLRLKGFKIEKLDSLCSIGTPDGEHNLSSHSFINFPIICIDESGIKLKINIKAHIVNIKYNLILGLETIKENNLTLRYASIFSSNKELDGLMCKPCSSEETEEERSRAIRAVSATSSSNESSETPEGMENILTASDPKHPKKRVTFKDEINPFDPDRSCESVGM